MGVIPAFAETRDGTLQPMARAETLPGSLAVSASQAHVRLVTAAMIARGITYK